MKRTYLSLLLFVFISFVSINQTNSLVKNNIEEVVQLPSQIADIDDIVEGALKDFDVPGVAIGVIYDGKIVLSKGFGYRDLSENLKVDSNTLFSIASNSKAFTAFIMGQLVDEGKLSWDDPVIQYIPEFRLTNPEITQQVTIRDLLAHRTGLPRHDFLWLNQEMERDSIIEKISYLDFASPFRQEFQYNNLTYTIAGFIIERVTHMSWEENVATRVLAPLKMNNSNFNADMLNTDNYSMPYAEIDGQIHSLEFLNPYLIGPAAGINSNVTDMLKWVSMQMSEGMFDGKAQIQKSTLEEIHTLQMPISDMSPPGMEIYPLGYSLGWFNGMYRGYFFLEHGGSMDGYISQVSILPQKKIAVVILSNSSSDGTLITKSLSRTIIDKLLNEQKEDWLAMSMAERADKKSHALQMFESNYGGYSSTISPSQLKEYEGEYEHPGYGPVKVVCENDHLVATYGNNIMDLEHLSEGVFEWKVTAFLAFGEKVKMDISFSKDDHGQYEMIIPFEPAVEPIHFKKSA